MLKLIQYDMKCHDMKCQDMKCHDMKCHHYFIDSPLVCYFLRDMKLMEIKTKMTPYMKNAITKAALLKTPMST